MTQLIQAFLISDRLVLSTLSTTTAGMWIADGDPKVLPSAASDAEKGQAISEALAGSRHGIRHPTQSEWKQVAEPLFRAAGVRSWSSFAKKALCCDIAVEKEGVVEVTPYVAQGTRGAFTPLSDKKILLKDASSSDLGSALTHAFEIAQFSK